MKTGRLTQLAMLTGVALIIFVLELAIPNPFPIPGVKLGLANIVTVYVVYHYRVREAAMLLLARILLGALFSGSAMTLCYSLAGGMLCLIGMLALRRHIPEKRIWLSSVLGAALHNLGQILVAMLLAGTTSLILYLPVLLISGCLAGSFTGLCAQLLLCRRIPVGREGPSEEKAP